MAGEDVDLEFLRAPVTLGEGEAVTLHGALLAAGTEQNLVDGKRGNLCTRGLIHNPGEKTDTPKKFWNILIQQDKRVLSVALKVNTFIKYNTHNGLKKKGISSFVILTTDGGWTFSHSLFVFHQQIHFLPTAIKGEDTRGSIIWRVNAPHVSFNDPPPPHPPPPRIPDLTEPSGPQGTCIVIGMGMALSARSVAMALCASLSFRGALTHVQPR